MSALEPADETCLVAVYGTLRRGNANAHRLADALFLGTDISPAIVLYDLGEYPGAKSGVSDGIEVEVYQVDSQILHALDQLEEFDPANPERSLYVRRELQTAFGVAWIYLYQGTVAGRRPIREGRWNSSTLGSGADALN